MNESILNTIKKMLGLAEDYDAFDQDVITMINSTLMTVTQLGVGPAEGFFITGTGETWSDLLEGRNDLDAVKGFVYLGVRILFDPPASGTVMDAYKSAMDEFGWRLNVGAEKND